MSDSRYKNICVQASHPPPRGHRLHAHLFVHTNLGTTRRYCNACANALKIPEGNRHGLVQAIQAAA